MFETGYANQAHKAITTTDPGVPAEYTVTSVDGQGAIVATTDPRGDEEMSQGLRYGAP